MANLRRFMSDGAAMVVHWLLLQTLLTGAVHVSYAEGLDAGDGYRATTPSKNFELSFATALGAHVTILRSEELCLKYNEELCYMELAETSRLVHWNSNHITTVSKFRTAKTLRGEMAVIGATNRSITSCLATPVMTELHDVLHHEDEHGGERGSAARSTEGSPCLEKIPCSKGCSQNPIPFLHPEPSPSEAIRRSPPPPRDLLEVATAQMPETSSQ